MNPQSLVTNLDKLKAKIVEANLEIKKRAEPCIACEEMMLSCDNQMEIRLADVLLAVKKHFKEKKDASGYSSFIDSFLSGGDSRWNLKDDNLDHQSPETLEFLYKIFNIV